MPIHPAGTEVGRDFHRLAPVHSAATAHTEAERLESLRRAACRVGADAVVEAVNEDVQGALVASGTAVRWLAK